MGLLLVFTNEIEFDRTITTVLDNEDEFSELKLIITDDCVYLEQWNSEDVSDMILLSHDQWYSLMLALKLPEGIYNLDKNYEKR